MNENNTIKELLEVIKGREENAGDACQQSQGSLGCEEAQEMQELYYGIKKLLK